MVAQLPL